jgi:hypothetical protein
LPLAPQIDSLNTLQNRRSMPIRNVMHAFDPIQANAPLDRRNYVFGCRL